VARRPDRCEVRDRAWAKKYAASILSAHAAHLAKVLEAERNELLRSIEWDLYHAVSRGRQLERARLRARSRRG
jgi:hypothetical protein